MELGRKQNKIATTWTWNKNNKQIGLGRKQNKTNDLDLEKNNDFGTKQSKTLVELGKHRIGLGVGTKFKTKADRTWNKTKQQRLGLGTKLMEHGTKNETKQIEL